MNDDAVAPVIAVMLILAALVTFLTVWNAVYVPSMKQSSEVEHLRNVESAFLHLASDIERVVSARQDHMTLCEPVQMGGGDFIFDTLRSGGSLSVHNEQKPVYNITLTSETGATLGRVNGTLVTISYDPVGNFWQDQGYQWQHGYINVTKHGSHKTPLGYYNMTDVTNEISGSGSLSAFARSFGSVDYTVNQSALPGNCSRLVLHAINLSTTPGHSFASGNGFGSVRLNSRVNRTYYCPGANVSVVSIGSGGTLFGNATLDGWNASLAASARACGGTVKYSSGSSVDVAYSIGNGIDPVEILLSTTTIEVGVY